MKKLYTSYFSRDGGNPRGISIAAWAPNWWSKERTRLLKLAPPPILLESYKNGFTNEEQYTSLYKLMVLDNCNAQKLVDLLPEGAILLCWEGPGKFCHRQLVSKWIMEKCTDVVVRELSDVQREEKEQEQARKKENTATAKQEQQLPATIKCADGFEIKTIPATALAEKSEW